MQPSAILQRLKNAYNEANQQLGEVLLPAEQGVRSIPYVGAMAGKAGLDALIAEDIANQNKPAATNPEARAEGDIGRQSENVLEFMAAHHLLGGGSFASLIDEYAPFLKTLRNSPNLTNTIGKMLTAGTIGATQAKAHGADTPQALLSGGAQALVTGLVEGVPAAAASQAAKVKPTMRQLTPNVSVPILRSQELAPLAAADTPADLVAMQSAPEPNGNQLANTAATIDESPKFQRIQQLGVRMATTDLMQQAVKGSLDRLNQTRSVPTITAPGLRLPASTPEITLDELQQFRDDFTARNGKAPTPEETNDWMQTMADTPQRPYQFTLHGAGDLQQQNEGSMVLPARARVQQTGTQVIERPEGTFDPTIPGASGQKQPVMAIRQYANAPETPGEIPAWIANPDEPGMAMPGRLHRFIPSPEPLTEGLTGPGTMTTSDPAAVVQHMTQLEQIMADPAFEKSYSPTQQDQIRAAAQNYQKQLDTFNSNRTRSAHFAPVDSAAIAEKINTPEDAVAQLRQHAMPVYTAIDKATDGQFAGWRKQELRALNTMKQPAVSKSAYNTATNEYQEALDNQQQLFDAHKEKFNEPEWRGANSAWRDASFIEGLQAVMERQANGIPQYVEDATGIARTQGGGPAAFRSLTNYLESRPEDAQRILGTEGRQSLYKMADLLRTPESAAKTMGYLNEMERIIRHHSRGVGAMSVVGGAIGAATGVGVLPGALAGAGVAAARKMFLFKAATDPLVADRLAYAVKNNLTMRTVGPILAQMMLRHRPPPTDQPPADQGGQQ
jgi:hypothetical protein